MKKSDRLLSAVIIGSPAPVFLALVFWWCGALLKVGSGALYVALVVSGFAAGVLLDATVLRRFIFRLFSLSRPVLYIICAFYAVTVYAAFMGFPVFNVLVGIFGTYIIIRKSVIHGFSKEASGKNIKSFFLFSFLLLLFICIVTAAIALNEASIGRELEIMLDLNFKVTHGLVWALILGGSAFLLGFQYLFSILVYKKMRKAL